MNKKHLILAATLIAHFVFMMFFFSPAISTPDANGYYAQARFIAQEGRTWFEPDSPLQYTGPHWLKTESGKFFSRYPPGLPVIAAAVYKFFGAYASLLVNPVLTTLSLLALYLICANWIGRNWGLLAVLVMAFNPMVNYQALSADSHAATAFFLIWAVYFAVKWQKSDRLIWIFAAGIFLGFVPLVRYAEVLFALGFLLFFLLNLPQIRKPVLSAAVGIIGFAVPFICLMVRNQAAFGAFWKTGYSLTGEQTAFSLGNMLPYAGTYLTNLMTIGGGLFFALGILGLVMLIMNRPSRRQGIFLLALIVPITLLYTAYYFPPRELAVPSLRFLYPIIYLITICAVWFLRRVTESHIEGIRVAIAVLVFFNCGWALNQTLQTIEPLKATDDSLKQITEVLETEVEPGSIVISQNSILQHLDFIGKWRLGEVSGRMRGPNMRGGRFNRVGNEDGESGNHVSPMQHRQRKSYMDSDGNLKTDEIRTDLKKWAGNDKKVYYLGNREELDRLYEVASSIDIIEKLDIETPQNSNGDAAGKDGNARRHGSRSTHDAANGKRNESTGRYRRLSRQTDMG